MGTKYYNIYITLYTKYKPNRKTVRPSTFFRGGVLVQAGYGENGWVHISGDSFIRPRRTGAHSKNHCTSIRCDLRTLQGQTHGQHMTYQFACRATSDITIRLVPDCVPLSNNDGLNSVMHAVVQLLVLLWCDVIPKLLQDCT